jgi:tRNA pseudouridine38-40 synthase
MTLDERRAVGDDRHGSVFLTDGPASPNEDLAVWRLDIVYEGTAFHGWARQPRLRTVQGVLEEALAKVLPQPVRLSVAGRTDAGVHAFAQVASFACAQHDLSAALLRRSLNALLPPDVAVALVSPASEGFVARGARSRTYRYRLIVPPVRPVADRFYVWSLGGTLDAEALQEAATLLLGKRDFAALTPSARLYRSCVRTVAVAEWRPVGADEWVFEIRADSFLHNMVRVAVGSMVDLARGRMSPAQFEEGLASGQRRQMGQTAPARGLALVAVEY